MCCIVFVALRLIQGTKSPEDKLIIVKMYFIPFSLNSQSAFFLFSLNGKEFGEFVLF